MTIFKTTFTHYLVLAFGTFWPLWTSAKLDFCSNASGVPERSYEIVAKYPHSEEAFTQGLYYHQGQLIETTGRYGHSSLRLVDLETGKPLKIHPLARSHFAEGVTLIGDQLVMLTWRNNEVIVFDANTFEQQATLAFPGEGWGVTTEGQNLWISNGSNILQRRSWPDFSPNGQLAVRYNEQPLPKINELEFVNGKLFANIWYTNCVAIIDPVSGEVEGRLDLTALFLLQKPLSKHAVLNGIAYNPEANTFYVTGKLWPNLFEIRLHESE